MPMYRLDYADDSTPVKNTMGDDFLSRHMSTARAYATTVAVDSGRAIQVSRIDNAGRVRPALVIRADGGAQPPQGAKQPEGVVACKAKPGGPPCFCPNCRAARRR